MSIKLSSPLAASRVPSVLDRLTQGLSDSTIKLSTGRRINKASDDAASLAIEKKLRLDTAIYTKGIRNLNDGISALSVAEGALTSLQEILSRIAELSTQSASGTVSDSQRAIMQKEVTGLQSEWNRIVDGTTFNGQKLLTGSDCLPILHSGTEDKSTLAAQIGQAALSGGFDNYAGSTERVSVSSAGTQAMSGATYYQRMSADGRYVAFESTSNDIVSGDGTTSDVFVRDRLTGTTTRVSTTSSGGDLPGTFNSYLSDISADGRYVTFYSATTVTSGDTNGVSDVFMKDLVTGKLTAISTTSSGTVGNAQASRSFISGDGRYVAFESTATNLVSGDTNAQQDVFLKDTLTGVTTRVSTDSSGAQATGASSSVRGISVDGRYVIFSSAATNLVSGDTNGASDLFMKDTVTGVTTRVSTDSAGGQLASGGDGLSISADNKYALFTSSSAAVADDTNALADLFKKDLTTGEVTRVNTSSSGAQTTTASGLLLYSTISADGRYVSFTSSSTDLVSGDTNGQADVFVKDTISGAITRASVSSAGLEGNDTTWSLGISADGRYVSMYSSANNLVSGDTNGTSDTFVRDLTKAGIQTLAGMVVSNRVSAKITLGLVGNYQDELRRYRGNIGSSIKRAESYLQSLSDAKLNNTAASSRISDVDIAEESANYTLLQIKQQTASDLLKRANLQPRIALTLLGK